IVLWLGSAYVIDTERQGREREDDHVGRPEPAELVIRQDELPLDGLEQREDDVAVGVVEEIDERQEPQGVRRVRPRRARGAGALRVCARQSSPPRARRGPPSPPGTP